MDDALVFFCLISDFCLYPHWNSMWQLPEPSCISARADGQNPFLPKWAFPKQNRFRVTGQTLYILSSLVESLTAPRADSGRPQLQAAGRHRAAVAQGTQTSAFSLVTGGGGVWPRRRKWPARGPCLAPEG